MLKKSWNTKTEMMDFGIWKRLFKCLFTYQKYQVIIYGKPCLSDVRAAAKEVAEGRLVLSDLLRTPEETAVSAMMRVCGVGVKVANCVSLFGLHHVDAFPIDVWMRRILENEYPGGYPKERYRHILFRPGAGYRAHLP